MYYDLHIHSALSPCADDSMTIHNIFNMAYIKGLDLIAICDHNSLKQQHHLSQLIENEILKGHLDFVHGVELQSQEEIHLLAYFSKGTDLVLIQNWLDAHLVKKENDTNYYGHQYILDEQDQIVGEEKYSLLQSLDLDIYEIIEAVHAWQGVVVLAHVLAKRYGIVEVYNGIPQDLDYDGLEVSCPQEYRALKKRVPDLKDCLILMNSDAHRLEDISEPVYQIEREVWEQLWRNRTCRKSQ